MSFNFLSDSRFIIFVTIAIQITVPWVVTLYSLAVGQEFQQEHIASIFMVGVEQSQKTVVSVCFLFQGKANIEVKLDPVLKGEADVGQQNSRVTVRSVQSAGLSAVCIVK
jgi:hypothetical protein